MEKKIAIIVIICCNMIHAHCNMTHAQNINYFYNRGERQYWTVDSTSINLIVADTADLPWIYQNAINYLHGDAEGYYSDEDDNLVINSRLLNGINVSVFLYEHICIGQRPYGHRPTPLQAFADAPVIMKICDDF